MMMMMVQSIENHARCCSHAHTRVFGVLMVGVKSKGCRRATSLQLPPMVLRLVRCLSISRCSTAATTSRLQVVRCWRRISSMDGRASAEEGSSTVPSAQGKFMPYLAVERFLLGARSPRLPSRVGSRGLPHLGQEHRLSLSRSLSPLCRSLFLDGSRTFVFRR